MYRVLILGNMRLFVEVLALLVTSVEGWSAWGELVDRPESVDLPEVMDLVLVDAQAADQAPERTKAVRDKWPDADVILLTRLGGPGSASKVDLRPIGAVSCESAPSALIHAILQARDHHHVPAPTPAPGRGDAVHQPRAELTSRQLEILRQLAAGRRKTEIAESLGISPQTVRTHAHNMMARLDVHSLLELVTVARRDGLLDAALESAV